MNRLAACLALALAAAPCGLAQSADAPDQAHHHHEGAAPAQHAMPATDGRALVVYPAGLRVQTLANMRDHLATLAEIQQALADSRFDRASELAESRLGMSSLDLHGAHEVARYMPRGMQEAGTAMHRAASQFALVAKDASASGDLKPVLASLAGLNRSCMACHAAYRLQ